VDKLIGRYKKKAKYCSENCRNAMSQREWRKRQKSDKKNINRKPEKAK